MVWMNNTGIIRFDERHQEGLQFQGNQTWKSQGLNTQIEQWFTEVLENKGQKYIIHTSNIHLVSAKFKKKLNEFIPRVMSYTVYIWMQI